MSRYGMICRLTDEGRERYRELHRAVRPEVETALSSHGITNFSLFLRGDVLFGYYEFEGSNHEEAQAQLSAIPAISRWLIETAACQRPFDEGSESLGWQTLEELWHLE